MLRTFRSARRNSARAFVSAIAMGAALAGGSVALSGAVATSAAAQEYSPAFVELYQPLQVVVNAPDGDVASVRGQFPALVAAASSADEQNIAGNLLVLAGGKLQDRALQRQGVELQLNSGLVPADRRPRYYFELANLAYDMEDYAAARDALQQAATLGFAEQDVTPLLFESQVQLGDFQPALEMLSRRTQELAASGAQVPQEWLLRGLQVAYNNRLAEPASNLAHLLVTEHTSPRSWVGALQVINAIGNFQSDTRLDLLRLMRLTDSLTNNAEYEMYVQAADPRIRSNEVDEVLAAGLASGQVSADDPFYVEVKQIVDTRRAGERAEASELMAEAEAETDGETAMIAGDLLYSLDDFAEAEAMYAMAIEKGGIDTQLARTRLGISQVRQGKFAEARSTLAEVTGPGAVVARMWSAYAETQSA